MLGSLALATLLSGAPHLHATPLLVLPLLGCMLGTADTVRCLQRRWSFYHGAVVVLIYMDIMALFMILFLLLYPYGRWLL